MGTDPLLDRDLKVVVFDTSCLLCSRFINILLRNDNRKLAYTGFESQYSKEHLPEDLILTPQTVVFIEKDKMSVKSKAVFNILKQVQYPLRLLLIFSVLPSRLSDKVYDWVAGNRYGWFGQSDSCYVPGQEEASRFLA